MSKITCEHWEDTDYIICINGKPFGMTVTKKNGETIKEWLENRCGLSSIRKEVETRFDAAVNDMFWDPDDNSYNITDDMLQFFNEFWKKHDALHESKDDINVLDEVKG